MPFGDNLLNDLDLAVNRLKSVKDPNIEKCLIIKTIIRLLRYQQSRKFSTNHDRAKELWERINNNPDFDLLSAKIKVVLISRKKITIIKFVNIVKTFRKFNERIYGLTEYTLTDFVYP